MRRGRRWLLGIVGLAALVATVAGLVFVDYPQASSELPEALKEYREQRLPWLASEIALPPVPDKENAAALVQQAIAAWPKKGLDYGPADTLPYGTIPDLAPFQRALDLVYEAVKRPRLDFRRDWDLGPFVTFSEEARVKDLVRALTARAEMRSRKGDDAGALTDLDTARMLGVLIAQDHGMIAAMVATSCQNMVTGQVRHCLATAAKDPSRLRRYRDWLARPAPLLDLRRHLRDEIFLTVATARNLDRMGIGTSWNPGDDLVGETSHCSDCAKLGELTSANVRRDGLPGPMRSRAYLARCLQMWTELSRQTNGLNERVELIAVNAAEIQQRYALPPTTSHLHDNVLFPSYFHFGRVNRSILASQVLAIAYADALLLRAKTGSWPTACDVPDPMGDGYLRVKTEGGRFQIWSAGRNGVDDGGFPLREPSDPSKPHDDLVAAYPPIARPPTKRPSPARLPNSLR